MSVTSLAPRSRRPNSVTTVALMLVALCAFALAGCSSSGSSTTSTSSTTLAPLPDATNPAVSSPVGTATAGGAQILRFDLQPRVECEPGARLAVPVTYETTGATTVSFVVDGEQVSGRPDPSGTYAIALECDGAAHTVVLTAIDPAGEAAVASRAVMAGVDGN
jgi:hypothetical protein